MPLKTIMIFKEEMKNQLSQMFALEDKSFAFVNSLIGKVENCLFSGTSPKMIHVCFFFLMFCSL